MTSCVPHSLLLLLLLAVYTSSQDYVDSLNDPTIKCGVIATHINYVTLCNIPLAH